MKERFKFIGTEQDGKILVWESVDRLPGSSCVSQIRCSRAWFWGQQ